MTTQDHPGLDASGYLLLAKGHLVKAREVLGEPLESWSMYRVGRDVSLAISYVRFALKQLELLKQEKEEACNKP